jgi:hypothetical protein
LKNIFGFTVNFHSAGACQNLERASFCSANTIGGQATMKRLLRFGIVMGALAAVPVYASGDSSCEISWKIKQTDRGGCSSTALLSPGNDTRVNLLMLLFDRHKAVGTPHLSSYNSEGRRGEAQPFDYPVFALGLAPKTANEKENEDNSAIGTRCLTNDAGAMAFIAAVNVAKDVPADERTMLVAARTLIKPQCESGELAREIAAKGTIGVTSKQGQNFARYLIGAAAFYDGDFGAAKTSFDSIAKPASPWLAGADSYMRGRVALNAAMADAFGEYGELKDGVGNAAALAEAEAGFLGYLKSYPEGEYNVSARGLLRKVYWLGHDKEKLVAAYVAQFAQTDASKRNVSLADLVQEIDNKVLMELDPSMVSDAVLLAVLDLQAMRHDGDPKLADSDHVPITRTALDAQGRAFTGNDALYAYVRAVHAFYVANDPAEVLRLIPARAENGYLGNSRQLLRTLALDAKGDAGARAALVAQVTLAKLPFQRGTAELALALHEERSKGLERVFAADSVIHDPDIREILLRYAAGPGLLRGQAVNKAAPKLERNIALYALLYKNLTRGGYADFIRDLNLIPAGAKKIAEGDYETPQYSDVGMFNWKGTDTGFVCPSIRNTANTLSVTPRDQQALLCLGEFGRLNGLDPDYYAIPTFLDQQPPDDELGGAVSLFPGKPFSRGEIYKSLIANPKVSAPNKAYALYRAVNCYGPSGYNGCGGADVPQSTRKAWFSRLKREFASSPWAQKLEYYW